MIVHGHWTLLVELDFRHVMKFVCTRTIDGLSAEYCHTRTEDICDGEREGSGEFERGREIGAKIEANLEGDNEDQSR